MKSHLVISYKISKYLVFNTFAIKLFYPVTLFAVVKALLILLFFSMTRL